MKRLEQLFVNLFNSNQKGSYVGLNDSVDSTELSQLQVESDNFDVVLKQCSDSKIEYKLLIKEGYTLSDIIFDVSSNAPLIAFSIKTKKSNVSGTLELSIPNSIVDINVKCVNGDIYLSRILLSFMNLATVNGDISVVTLDGDYKISCDSLNGDVLNKKKTNPEAQNAIICSSVNGDITIK